MDSVGIPKPMHPALAVTIGGLSAGLGLVLVEMEFVPLPNTVWAVVLTGIIINWIALAVRWWYLKALRNWKDETLIYEKVERDMGRGRWLPMESRIIETRHIQLRSPMKPANWKPNKDDDCECPEGGPCFATVSERCRRK